jgi:hypothetical protein
MEKEVDRIAAFALRERETAHVYFESLEVNPRVDRGPSESQWSLCPRGRRGAWVARDDFILIVCGASSTVLQRSRMSKGPQETVAEGEAGKGPGLPKEPGGEAEAVAQPKPGLRKRVPEEELGLCTGELYWLKGAEPVPAIRVRDCKDGRADRGTWRYLRVEGWGLQREDLLASLRRVDISFLSMKEEHVIEALAVSETDERYGGFRRVSHRAEGAMVQSIVTVGRFLGIPCLGLRRILNSSCTQKATTHFRSVSLLFRPLFYSVVSSFS